MKITAAEFREWHDTAWPEGYAWYDGSEINGADIYADDGSIAPTLPETFIVPDDWSLEREIRSRNRDDADDYPSVRSFIKKWRKEKSTATVTLSLPKDKLDELLALAKANGWRVLR